MPGWIKLPRDIDQRPFWNKDKPYCSSCAFIDLMLRAAFQTHSYVFEGINYLINPGDIITSRKRLAEKWNWSIPKVSRFLKALEQAGEVKVSSFKHIARITLCRWSSYQVAEATENAPSVKETSSSRSPNVKQTLTYNKDKKEKNEKKKSENILKFAKAKKSHEELSEEEKILALECAKFYEQTLKSKIDFNKLAILVYGSELDQQEHGFGDWLTLRKALGQLFRDRLIYKVLHPYYYLWGLSRDKSYVQKIKKP